MSAVGITLCGYDAGLCLILCGCTLAEVRCEALSSAGIMRRMMSLTHTLDTADGDISEGFGLTGKQQLCREKPHMKIAKNNRKRAMDGSERHRL